VHRDVSVGPYDDTPKPAVGVDGEFHTELRADSELAVIGPIDTGTVDRFRLQVLEAARGGARDLTIDLDPVSVLSSSSVRTLYELRRELPNLRLHAAPSAVAGRVLTLIGLDQRPTIGWGPGGSGLSSGQALR
jgi:anti-anti-sigma regulatory factor